MPGSNGVRAVTGTPLNAEGSIGPCAIGSTYELVPKGPQRWQKFYGSWEMEAPADVKVRMYWQEIYVKAKDGSEWQAAWDGRGQRRITRTERGFRVEGYRDMMDGTTHWN